MLKTVRATDLQGNPKDAHRENHIRTRIGYGVWSAKDGNFADSVESLEHLIGQRLYLVDPTERRNDILTSTLREVRVQEDGSVHLVTNNTIYVMERVE